MSKEFCRDCERYNKSGGNLDTFHDPFSCPLRKTNKEKKSFKEVLDDIAKQYGVGKKNGKHKT